jgi:hypothetical protein
MYPEAEAKSEIGSTRYVSDGLVIGIDMFDLDVKYVNIRACHEADAEWLTNLHLQRIYRSMNDEERFNRKFKKQLTTMKSIRCNHYDSGV